MKLSPVRVPAPLSHVPAPTGDPILRIYTRRLRELDSLASSPSSLYSSSANLLNWSLTRTKQGVQLPTDALSNLCDAAYDAVLRETSDDPISPAFLRSLIDRCSL